MKLIPAFTAIIFFIGMLISMMVGGWALSVAGVTWSGVAPAAGGIVCFIVSHYLFKLMAQNLYRAGT